MELSSKPVGTRRSKKQIVKLLNKFEESAVSIKEFCSEHHINPATFHKG